MHRVDHMVNYVVVGILSRNTLEDEKSYLLVRSKKDFGQFSGYWYPPGGHVEQDEDMQVALIREIKEELGLDVRVLEKIAETPGDIVDQMTSWWNCELISDQIQIDEDEIAEAGWFTEKEMNDLKLWPATKDFFERFIF